MRLIKKPTGLQTFVFFAMVLSCSLLVFNAARAEANGSFTATETEDIRQIIHDYLMENPQVMLDSVEEYKLRLEREKMAKHADILYGKTAPSVGNAEGDLTIVEFFDYNCGYCKKAYEEVQKLITQDKDLRVTFVEMPILHESSILSAQWALAAHKQGKYWEFHKALMTRSGSKNLDVLSSIAKEIGLDVEQMKKDSQSQEVIQTLERNKQIAAELGINGTPAFIFGNQVIKSYLSLQNMEALIAEVRKQNKNTQQGE